MHLLRCLPGVLIVAIASLSAEAAARDEVGATATPVGVTPAGKEHPADELRGDAFWQPERAQRAHSYGSVRTGGSSADQNGMPIVCAEIAPFRFLGVEACGTGAGLWHEEPGREIAHFRLELTPLGSLFGPRLVVRGVAVDPQLGLGFAELQLGADAPGFRFGSSRGTADTSGPEATLALRALSPIAYGMELSAELDAAIAYFPHAGELVQRTDALQPSLALSLGLGF